MLRSARPAREDVAIVALTIACTFAAVWPVIANAGVPLFAHDWSWSPYAARSVWTWELLRSSWAEVGLGERNSAISVNPLAWLKVALPIVLSGRVSQIVYLCGSLVVAGLGTYRLTRENLAVPVRFAWTCVPLLLASPFVFDKIASGQSSYWAGFAAFVWGLSLALDAFETNARGTLLASAACFALASVQLQFLAFAWLAYAVRAAVARRGSAVGAAVLGCAASTTLALPSLWFLASRGALAGAAISPPYRSWLAALSATPADAAATLGYVGRYAERAVADTPAVLGVTHVAAFALIGAALFAAATVRSANTGTLAILGALGWWWLTGVDGPFGSLRELLFLNVADAGFFREYYHAGALYAVALVALGTLGISRLPGVLGPLRLPLALGAVVAFGPQTWSGGLGRILAFAAAPRTTGALAAAAGNEEARVLFLPAQQPLRTKGDAVGGNDGLDWIDARHHSAYEYYLPPLVATIAQAVARGDARTARRLLFRIDASAVVFRTFLRSGEGGERDRSLATLTAAFGPPAQAGPGTLLFAVPHAPMLDAPDRLAPQPADLGAMADAPRLAYADVPGTDVQPFAVDLDRSSPDPRAGWIARRDAPVVDAARIAADAYGVITLREGAAVTFRDLPGGNLLGWDPAHGLMRRSVPAGDLRIVAPGPEAVIEAGEMPFPPPRLDGMPEFLTRSHDAPWSYRATLRLRGRGAVVLRERFDEQWRFEGPPGLAVERHLRADGFANAWIVSGNGTFDVRLSYGCQPVADALLAASLAFFALTLAGALAWGRA